MSKAWIALSLAAVATLGCQSSGTEPVSQVPPPSFAAEPEPLPPVAINQGSAQGTDPYGEAGLSGTPEGYNPGGFDPEPLPSVPVSRTYTIRKNDTLWSIARREYGDGRKWKDIARANPSVQPRKLAVGQQITLP